MKKTKVTAEVCGISSGRRGKSHLAAVALGLKPDPEKSAQ